MISINKVMGLLFLSVMGGAQLFAAEEAPVQVSAEFVTVKLPARHTWVIDGILSDDSKGVVISSQQKGQATFPRQLTSQESSALVVSCDGVEKCCVPLSSLADNSAWEIKQAGDAYHVEASCDRLDVLIGKELPTAIAIAEEERNCVEPASARYSWVSMIDRETLSMGVTFARYFKQEFTYQFQVKKEEVITALLIAGDEAYQKCQDRGHEMPSELAQTNSYGCVLM